MYMEIGDLEVLFGSYDSLRWTSSTLMAKEKLQKRQVEIDMRWSLKRLSAFSRTFPQVGIPTSVL